LLLLHHLSLRGRHQLRRSHIWRQLLLLWLLHGRARSAGGTGCSSARLLLLRSAVQRRRVGGRAGRVANCVGSEGRLRSARRLLHLLLRLRRLRVH
ncbi:hypothetical protein PMAYCL1PPCAC_15293, partial [Pristionchus mayeri]